MSLCGHHMLVAESLISSIVYLLLYTKETIFFSEYTENKQITSNKSFLLIILSNCELKYYLVKLIFLFLKIFLIIQKKGGPSGKNIPLKFHPGLQPNLARFGF